MNCFGSSFSNLIANIICFFHASQVTSASRAHHLHPEAAFSDEVRSGLHCNPEAEYTQSSSSSWTSSSSVSSTRSASPAPPVAHQAHPKHADKDEAIDYATSEPSPAKKKKHSRVNYPADADQSGHECEFCGCAFVDYPSLHTHRYLLHRYIAQNDNYLPYMCAVCGDRRTTQRAMIQHMLTHNYTNGVPLSTTARPANEPNLLAKANRRKQPQPRKIVKSNVEPCALSTGSRSAASCGAFLCKICRKEFVTYTQHIQHQKFFKH